MHRVAQTTTTWTKGDVKMKRQWVLGTTSVILLALILVIVGVSGAYSAAAAASAAILVVNSPNDGGPGTLRQAMLDAVSGDTIVFDPVVFPPGSPVSITLASDLPTLDQGNVTIDGDNAGVILDGSDVTPGHGDGIYITSDGNLIRELQILYFPGDGLEIYGGASNNTVVSNTISGNAYTGINIAGLGTTGNQVTDNLIGTDPAGTAAIGGNYMSGIAIREGAQYNTIAGNLISGNDADGVVVDSSGTDHNVISGNYIGTDIGGTYAVPNGAFGILLNDGAQRNTIGGDSPEERNLVSGNVYCGIVFMGAGTDHNVISGNYIGTDVNGIVAIGNLGCGVSIQFGPRYNVGGGAAAGERNVISGNTDPGWGVGVIIDGAGTDYNTVLGNYIGTDVSGMAALGNGDPGCGISIEGGASHNAVGGSATEERNLVSGNQGSGICIVDSGTVSNTVSGNYIGTDATGTTVISNTGTGISIGNGATYTLIGGDGTTPAGACTGACNLISGNGGDEWEGVRIEDSGTTSNTVTGNFIGMDAAGTSALPNASGIAIVGGAQHNRIGGDTPEERNLISGNVDDGIALRGGDSGHNSISGNYIGMDASGTFTIPNGYYGINIESSYNTVGGINATPGGACSGACNLISGNCYGLQIVGSGAVSNTVTGNYVGTDATGTVAVTGACWGESNGIFLGHNAAHNRIGGTTEGERNVLAGTLWFGPPDSPPRYNWVAGNYVGVGATGTTSVANGYHGIGLSGSDNLIGGDVPGAGNLISGFDHDGISITGSGNWVAHNEIYGNDEHGVQVTSATALTNTLSQNSIYANSGLGIDLVDGGNTELSAPIVFTYDTAAGTASGIACPSCTVELFSDDDDEGRWFEGVVTADAIGRWSFDKGSAFVGPQVHATATDGGGNTSEFSTELRDVAVVGATPDGQVPLGEAVAVRAELYNAGHWTEDQVPVACSIEDPTGSTVYDENALSGEIPPGTWALVDFPAWTPSQEGEHLLTCQSQLPSDQDPTNDLFTQTVTAVLCAPDVWTKDNEDDTGDVPTDPPWFRSPDLWVRNLPDGGLDHQNPIPGEENTLYVRLRNRGCGTAEWGEVHLFAGPSKLGWPCLGSEPNVGTITFEDLAPGEERIVSISWIPDGGPYLSLRSVIEAEGDPAQWQPGCSPHQPRFDNNISWRNVHIIDNRADLLQRGTGAKQVEVVLNNIYDWPNEVDLVVERMTFPVTGTITVTLPAGLFDRWLANDGPGSEGIEVLTATKEIRVTGAVSATIGGIPMSASEQATTTLTFDGPAGFVFEMGLRERIHDLTVGGVILQWVIPEGGYEIYLPLVLRNR
jgi:hypothetical protein